MDPEAFDQDVLETAVARKPALAALAEEPHHRRELQEALDLSKTTCHRIVRSFDEKGLLRRTDRGYELTRLGEVVETQVDRFDANVRAAYRLRPLLEAFEPTDVAFDVELFTDATVTRPRPDDPSPPMNRGWERFREAELETIRIVDGTQFAPPLYERSVIETAIESEVTGEAIIPRSYAEHLVSEYPDLHRAFEGEGARVRYRIHDDIPFGMTLHDEYMELRAYDDETGSLLLFVDTDDPDALAWGEEVYEHYHEKADPPSAVESLPDWLPDPDVEF